MVTKFVARRQAGVQICRGMPFSCGRLCVMALSVFGVFVHESIVLGNQYMMPLRQIVHACGCVSFDACQQ